MSKRMQNDDDDNDNNNRKNHSRDHHKHLFEMVWIWETTKRHRSRKQSEGGYGIVLSFFMLNWSIYTHSRHTHTHTLAHTHSYHTHTHTCIHSIHILMPHTCAHTIHKLTHSHSDEMEKTNKQKYRELHQPPNFICSSQRCDRNNLKGDSISDSDLWSFKQFFTIFRDRELAIEVVEFLSLSLFYFVLFSSTSRNHNKHDWTKSKLQSLTP